MSIGIHHNNFTLKFEAANLRKSDAISKLREVYYIRILVLQQKVPLTLLPFHEKKKPPKMFVRKKDGLR